jgi:Chaperonin GroEL (HSP60 family)
LRQIAENAGQEGAIILQETEKRGGNMGYNALTGEFVDMIKAGILDPTKVVRCALENAVSIASILITTEAIIADLPKKDAPAPAMAQGMDY